MYHRICRNKRPGRLIYGNNKKNSKTNRFCALPPLKNHPPKAIGFMYSPLWKITHQNPSVSCTLPLWKITHQKPSVLCPFEKALFWVSAHFDKYGKLEFCQAYSVFVMNRGNNTTERRKIKKIGFPTGKCPWLDSYWLKGVRKSFIFKQFPSGAKLYCHFMLNYSDFTYQWSELHFQQCSQRLAPKSQWKWILRKKV